eukprot:190344-Chlamydomonas_euryale.AAC.1
MLVEKEDYEGARTLYVEAAGIEPYCVEAIYNLGLLNIKEQKKGRHAGGRQRRWRLAIKEQVRRLPECKGARKEGSTRTTVVVTAVAVGRVRWLPCRTQA